MESGDDCGSVTSGSVLTVGRDGRKRVTTRSPAETGATGGKTRAPAEAGVTQDRVGGILNDPSSDLCDRGRLDAVGDRLVAKGGVPS